jgi:hypothetical protein
MHGECKFGMWCNYAHGYEYIHTLKIEPQNARGLLHRRERLMLTKATLRNKLKNTNYELDESEVEDKPSAAEDVDEYEHIDDVEDNEDVEDDENRRSRDDHIRATFLECLAVDSVE